MINYVYQLIAPKIISPKLAELEITKENVIVRPAYMAICHADQRYYRGLRSKAILSQKLPMALIHEAAGVVVHDPQGVFKAGDSVVMIPNIPSNSSPFVDENYQSGAHFRSSNADGFMQEYVSLPHDRLVKYENIPHPLAAITEFASVAAHAVHRLTSKAKTPTDTIGIWGDGSMAYTVANMVKQLLPKAKIIVVGRDYIKLSLFTFANETYLDTDLPKQLAVDHAFECTGGQGCEEAINQIISTIRPEGCIMLIGVSETKVPILTRDVLEKGLTLVGCSRSGRQDFEKAVQVLSQSSVQNRMKLIISQVKDIHCVSDINAAFEADINNPYKTVLKWQV